MNICNNVDNNIFLTDISNCSNYFICVNRQPIRQTCDFGLYFDASSQSCVGTSKNCLNCNNNTLTFVPMTKTCNKYVMCFAGVPMLRECADNLQFNPITNQCDLPTKVDCVDNRCAIENNLNDIIYIPSAAACDKYYICMNGIPVNNTCAATLQFNPETNLCDLASIVKCSIKPLSRSAYSDILSPQPQFTDINCPQTGTHFYPHASSNQYYLCVNGMGAEFTCAQGLFYDSKLKECRQLKNILLN